MCGTGTRMPAGRKSGPRWCDVILGAAAESKDSGGGTRADVRTAALERASLVFAHSAPDAGVLAAGQSPGQAVGSRGAAVAHGLRLGDLQQSRTAGSHREEQLGVLVSAGRVVAPVHVRELLHSDAGGPRHSSGGRV